MKDHDVEKLAVKTLNGHSVTTNTRPSPRHYRSIHQHQADNNTFPLPVDDVVEDEELILLGRRQRALAGGRESSHRATFQMTMGIGINGYDAEL
ncbi:hypothetical protein BFJ63_vAg18889 [Fusarium oxysporum f. sp. narcissi]|uniref:Uncharacterized protein n=1 Tax=Fusarium oxysporum f. sp. narcissi TaxID=451672 RepID=A0A4Q2V343_FUSOX|nr:hypothetical protein BFJ63_vAg18889 [Fusarium oxysporum f. sp. narcissi]